MKNPRHYSVFPRELLQVGVVLEVSLHVYLPTNGSLLLFRKAGDKFGQEDLESFQKIPEERLLYADSEAPKLNEMRSKLFQISLEQGNLNAPAVKATAASVLQGLSPASDLNTCLDEAANLVQNLLRDFKKSSSITAYDEALRRAASGNSDPLDAHHKQVSTVAVLMALTIGDFSMDDLSDLATAGLIHDLGLRGITQSLADSHVKEIKKLENQEKIIYMRHVGLTLDAVKMKKIPVTPGVIRIIEQHHENWNGSGFKSAAGAKIYRPARVLRMADDLVSLVQNSANRLGFADALARMSQENGAYDPQMFKALFDSMRPARPTYKLEPQTT